jgi:hypothetical protein
MLIHAERDEVEKLPAWGRRLLDEGWSAPDSQGRRQALPSLGEVGPLVAAEMTAAMQDPNVVELRYEYSTVVGAFAGHGTERPYLGTAVYWKSRLVQIVHALTLAWNRGASLSECLNCGRLLEPDKGRSARLCSPRCTTAWHRRQKGA